MKKQILQCKADEQAHNNRRSYTPTKLLAWYHNPIVRSLMLTVLFILALQYDRRLTFLLTLIAILSLLAIVINIVILVTSLIVMVIKDQDKQILIRHFVQTCFAIAIPILVISNRGAIGFVSTYLVVHIMEPSLLQQAQQLPSQLFRYARFDFRQVPGSGNWVIYDESDQVLLPPYKRSQEWWLATKEDREADIACFSKAQPLYSHFFIRFDNCS